MTEDNLKVSAGSDGASIEISGANADRVISQLTDILSLVSEPAGLIGDSVKRQRDRLNMLYQASLEAKRQIEERDITPTPKSLRVMEEWITSASRAESEDVALKWGQLLLSESADMVQLLFNDLLKKIGSEEARWLDDLWSWYDLDRSATELTAAKIDAIRSAVRKVMFSSHIEDELEEAADHLTKILLEEGILVKAVEYEAYYREKADKGGGIHRFRLTWEPEHIFPDAFATIGILSLDHFSINIPKDHTEEAPETVLIQSYLFTRIGAEFMRETFVKQ